MTTRKINSILITGCNGLLGKNLCKKLSLLEYDIYGIARNNLFEPIKNVNYLIQDISNFNSQSDLPKNIDCIIHLAQSSNFRNFPESAGDIFNVNVGSTAFLLDYARSIGIKKFIFASSGGIYGQGSNSFDENAEIVSHGDLGFYLGTKTCGEILVQSYSQVFQVNIIRPFFIYGFGQNRSMLIPRMMDSIINSRPILIQGSNGIRINPIHVDDASSALISLLNYDKSSIFNIAGPEILSMYEISEKMASYLGKKPIYKKVEGDSSDIIADISLMKKELHVPQKTISQSMEDIVGI